MKHRIAYCIGTFGCKSNQYESQAVRESLNRAGHVECGSAAGADAYIVNTCAVTGRAGAACRNAIRKAVRANPDILVVITGCGVDLEEAWPELPRPPVLVPNAKKHALADALEESWNAAEVAPDRFGLRISAFEGHTRAFLKVQDGCDNFCSYCAVPHARGKPESRNPEEVLAEAERLTAAGHKEIVLTGINIGAYNHNGDNGRNALTLACLVEQLAATKNLERLRLGSVEPPQLTEQLVRAMASNPRICPHVHLPLQSGDDALLAAMRRRYATKDFLEKVALLHKYLDRPAVSTDVIVGFPGETDESAERTERLCREAGFSRLHVFLFSPRPGTPAAAMRQTSTNTAIERRKTSLIRAGQELAAQYAASCVGLRERVITENSNAENSGAANGINAGGLCDRYVKTSLPRPAHPGEVVRVVISGVNGAELQAETQDAATAE